MTKRIVFMGTPDFAVPSLHCLHASGLEVCAVITGPPKPVGRGRTLQPTPVSRAAESLNIPILTVSKLRDPEFLEQYKKLHPDLAVVVAFRILPDSMLKVPPLGTINLHGSLLPLYRGAAPIQRALMDGVEKTGVTAFVLDPQIDTGQILDTLEIGVEQDDTFGQLAGRMQEKGAKFLCDVVQRHCRGESKPYSQDDSCATVAPKIKAQDCPVNWPADAVTIHNHIRALSPAPAAESILNGVKVKLLRSHVIDTDVKTAEPGVVVLAHPKQGLHIQCGRGQLELVELVKAGKKISTGKQFVGGRQIQLYDILT